MAKRLYFISSPNESILYKEKFCEFKYYNGFALLQKQKSVYSLHENILKTNSELKVLEISTKSTCFLGVELSAFNLKFYDEITKNEYYIENLFQSSKVFEKGGPYKDLLCVSPKEAKRDERLKSSGPIIAFDMNNTLWEIEPKTMFYDWLYIKALSQDERLANAIIEYNCFTDIEFNHEKSINCQARAAAIFVSLAKMNIVEETINSKEKFKNIYGIEEENLQLSFT